jgi:sec-independent protein translocase protein TatA
MTAWTLLFISGQEILVVVLAVLLLFGSKEIPRMARMFGQGMKEFRRATEDIKREMQESSADVVKDFKEIRDDLKKDANEVVENVKKHVDSDSGSDRGRGHGSDPRKDTGTRDPGKTKSASTSKGTDSDPDSV